MKKILNILTIITCLITFNVRAIELDIDSDHAILYNLDSKEILYKKDEETKIQIASLTKIMTALVTLDKVDNLDEEVVITYADLQGLVEKNLVTAGFAAGQKVTYRDLLYGLLLPSGADAAMALARNVGGSEAEFINLMNEKVKELKLTNTNFSNPIGLDDENNYSTTKEISIIFNRALQNAEFKKIITTKEYTTSDGYLNLKSTISSNAKKYNIEVPYILGGKTGTTDGAGLCLATIAFSNDVNYLLVTTQATYDKIRPHHIDDAKTIYDYFITNYSNQKIVDKTIPYKKLNTKYLKEKYIKLYPKDDIVKYLPNDYDKKDIKYEYKGVKEVSPFTKKKLGKLKIYYKDELLREESVYLKTKTHFSLSKFLKSNIVFIVSPILVITIIIIWKKRK